MLLDKNVCFQSFSCTDPAGFSLPRSNALFDAGVATFITTICGCVSNTQKPRDEYCFEPHVVICYYYATNKSLFTTSQAKHLKLAMVFSKVPHLIPKLGLVFEGHKMEIVCGVFHSQMGEAKGLGASKAP